MFESRLSWLLPTLFLDRFVVNLMHLYCVGCVRMSIVSRRLEMT